MVERSISAMGRVSTRTPSRRTEISSAILAISTLGFLGYGTPPPTPEWGLIIAEGRNFVATAWWLTVLPGLVVMAIVLATHQIGNTLRKVTS